MNVSHPVSLSAPHTLVLQDGKLMFSLEANNLYDEDGNSKQTMMPYFENGWVEEEEDKPSGSKSASGFKLPWQK